MEGAQKVYSLMGRKATLRGEKLIKRSRVQFPAEAIKPVVGSHGPLNRSYLYCQSTPSNLVLCTRITAQWTRDKISSCTGQESPLFEIVM